MGIFARLCEQVRSEIDDLGAKGCYAKSVEKFSKRTGLPTDGLWAAVEGHLEGAMFKKLVERLVRAYGGDPVVWLKWLAIISKQPDCAKLQDMP